MTLRDLGVPTIIGAVVGAILNALAQARGRTQEHERTLDMLVLQWERAAADAADDALRDLRRRVLDSENPGLVHNTWQDQVLPRAARVGDAEIMRRVGVVGWVLFLATHPGQGAHWTYAAADSIEDAQAALAAFLKRRDAPPARFPTVEELRALVTGPGGSLARLNEHLAS